MPPEYLPVIQITLPVILAIFGAAWLQNRRVDELSKRVDDFRADMKEGFAKVDKRFEQIDHRLERIETALTAHGERIAKLEGRIPPLVRN